MELFLEVLVGLFQAYYLLLEINHRLLLRFNQLHLLLDFFSVFVLLLLLLILHLVELRHQALQLRLQG